MPNAWIEHVRGFAKKNNLSYGCAMTNPKVKDGYVPATKTRSRPAKAKAPTASEFNARIKERFDKYTPKEQEELRAKAKAERQKKSPVVKAPSKPIKKKLVVSSGSFNNNAITESIKDTYWNEFPDFMKGGQFTRERIYNDKFLSKPASEQKKIRGLYEKRLKQSGMIK